MQRRFKQFPSAVVFLLVLMFPAASSLSQEAPSGKTKPRITKRASRPRIQVQFDPRIELYSIVLYLADEPLLKNCKATSYQQDIDKYFGPYKKHPAIEHLAQIKQQEQIPPWNVLGFSTTLKKTFTKDENISKRNPQLEPLIDEIRDFAEKSRFQAFYSRHRKTYAQITRKIQQDANKKIHMEWFEKFFGPQPNKTFIICPNILLGTSGACCSSFETKDGNLICYAILGIFSCDDKGIPRDIGELMLVHEFIHSYTTPPLDQYRREMAKPAQKIFDAIQTRKGKSTCYSRWDNMLYETLTDACRARYRYKYEGPQGCQAEIEKSRKVKLFLTENLTNLLAEYETKREQYPTFEDFFPRIVEFYNTQTDRIIQELDQP